MIKYENPDWFNLHGCEVKLMDIMMGSCIEEEYIRRGFERICPTFVVGESIRLNEEYRRQRGRVELYSLVDIYRKIDGYEHQGIGGLSILYEMIRYIV